MSRSTTLKSLQQILQVRQAQRLGAEMQVMRATSALHELNAEHNQSTDRLRATEDRWAALISAPLLDLQAVTHWSAAIWDGQAELERTRLKVVEARAEKESRSIHWRGLEVRTQVVADLLRIKSRRANSLSEERRIAAAADRFAQNTVAI